jgi:hypothetical protein
LQPGTSSQRKLTPHAQQYGTGDQLGLVIQDDHPVLALLPQADGPTEHRDLHPEAVGLLHRAACQIASAEGLREPWIVLHDRAEADLATRHFLLQYHSPQAFRGSIDRRRQPGRTAADNDQIVEPRIRIGVQPEPPGELPHIRIHQDTAVREDDYGIALLPSADVPRGSRRNLVAFDVEPAIADPAAGQERLDLVHPRRPSMPDDAHLAFDQCGMKSLPTVAEGEWRLLCGARVRAGSHATPGAGWPR